jgi:anti-sigma-K factor RskA
MNERIDDLIALAALGELTAEESRELNDAMRADPLVAEEVAASMAAAASLQSATAEDPPPTLKLSVMDAIAGVEQVPAASPAVSREPMAPQDPVAPVAPEEPVAGGGAAGVDDVAPDDVDGSSAADTTTTRPTSSGANGTDTTGTDTTVRPIGSHRSRRGLGPWLVAAAAAIAVVVGAVVVLSSGDEANPGDEIAAVIEADDAVQRPMAGEIGDLEVVYSATQDALVVTGQEIEPVGDDATYQVWLVDDAGPTSIGIAVPDGSGALRLRADGVDPAGAVVAITVEPLGGSEQPTMPIVAQTA